MKWLVFDISNVLHRTFFAQKNEDDQTIAGLATHSALTTLNKYFKIYQPDRVVMAMDRKSWRKAFTASDACLSKKPYKGNRRQDMTPAQQEKYARFMNHLKEFEQLIYDHTTIVTLAADGLEADDLIAGFCQYSDPNVDEVTIISTDTDLLQLYRHPNVTIISPATDKQQTLSEYSDDAKMYTFIKCMRGDPTDNVQSAYPRVRTDRLIRAYNDPFERANIMDETWTNQDGVTFTVKDLFHENEILINLEKQPPEIRELMEDTIIESLQRNQQFSMFHLLQFIGKYKLNRIKDTIDTYIPMLSRDRK